MRSAPAIAAGALSLLGLALAPAARSATVPNGFLDGNAVTVLPGVALDFPVGLAFLPDGRLLVVEQKTAKIRLFVDRTLAVLDPVVQLADVQTAGAEQGLLGIAVDPRWPNAPYVYIHCDDAGSSSIRVSRYTVTGELRFVQDGHLAIDPATRYDVLAGLPDLASNHNGGTLRFGPDGMLYVSLGDDMDHCAAQDSSVMVGKILRLDVRGLPPGPGGPAPLGLIAAAGNPYKDSPDSAARLVWAKGLRNPFRFHIDPADGSLFIGDVGEDSWEELDHVAGGGHDLGWPEMEGPAVYGLACPNPLVSGDPPIYAFPHPEGEAIISAGPYRPPALGTATFPPPYAGNVFLSDYYGGFLRRLLWDGSSWRLATPVAGQPSATDWGEGFDGASDWLVGPDGALWYCRQSVNGVSGTGQIRRISAIGDSSVPPRPEPVNVHFPAPRPRPARGTATFHFTLSRTALVSLRVYDARGRLVRTVLAPRSQSAGGLDIAWDGNDGDGRAVRSGLYFVRLEVDGQDFEHRLPFLR